MIPVAIHCIRGWVLSGAPLYPSTLLLWEGLPWAADSLALQNLAQDVKAWARLPGENYRDAVTGWDWVGGWLSSTRNVVRVELPLALSVLAIVVMLLLSRRNFMETSGLRALMLPFAFALLVAFVMAPDARFMGPMVWVIAVLCLVGLLRALAQYLPGGVHNLIEWTDTHERALLAALLCFVSVGLALGSDSKLRHLDEESLLRIVSAGFQSVPTPPYKTVTLPSGLMVNTPNSGDQCWDIPLPCSSAPNNALWSRETTISPSGYYYFSRADALMQ